VTVKKVEAQHLPEVNEDFVKSLGIEAGTVEALRADIKKNLEREVKFRVLARNKAAVMDALVKVAELDLPKALITAEDRASGGRCPRGPEAARHQGRRQGPDPGRDLRAAGRARVRLGLVVAELVRANNLQAKPEQLQAHIEELAQSYEKPAEVVRWYLSDRQRMAEVEAVVIENNVTDFVLARPRSPTRRCLRRADDGLRSSPEGRFGRSPEESPEPVGRAFFFDRTVFLQRHNGQQDNRHHFS
jgi:trigger factor